MLNLETHMSTTLLSMTFVDHASIKPDIKTLSVLCLDTKVRLTRYKASYSSL